MGNFRRTGLARVQAQPLSDILRLCAVTNGLDKLLYRRIVCEAWNEVSGVGTSTIRRTVRDGRLYVTISSSVLRSTLKARSAFLLKCMNDKLCGNELLKSYMGDVPPVSEIIFR